MGVLDLEGPPGTVVDAPPVTPGAILDNQTAKENTPPSLLFRRSFTVAAPGIDAEGFLRTAENTLHPIAPIMTFAVKKQLNDLNATSNNLTPEVARKFIDRMVGVLKTFAPPAKVEEVRQTLLRELRKSAPGYADVMAYGGK